MRYACVLYALRLRAAPRPVVTSLFLPSYTDAISDIVLAAAVLALIKDYLSGTEPITNLFTIVL
jgi:hypothetical protein